MVKSRIDLSFSADTPLAATPPLYGYGSSNDQDTAVLDTAEPDENNREKLEDLRIGSQTVAEVVKGLETILGHELYPASIVQQDGNTTRIFLEQHLPSRTKAEKSNTIYDITDGGEVSTDMVRLPETGHRLEDNIFVKFKTRFTKPPSVIIGLNYLHMWGDTRIDGGLDIYEHLFEIHSHGWGDNTIFRGAGFTWFAVPRDTHLLLQVGSFSTLEDHPWNVKKDHTHRWITFPDAYKSPPKVVVWLKRLETNTGANERVMVFATDITTTGFTVHINTWGDSVLHSAGITWFAYPADTPGICSGELRPTKGTAGVVTFEKPFAKPPRRILVALNKLDSDKATSCRFKIIHEAVSERGMAVRVETWGDSKLHAAEVSYIAIE